MKENCGVDKGPQEKAYVQTYETEYECPTCHAFLDLNGWHKTMMEENEITVVITCSYCSSTIYWNSAGRKYRPDIDVAIAVVVPAEPAEKVVKQRIWGDLGTWLRGVLGK